MSDRMRTTVLVAGCVLLLVAPARAQETVSDVLSFLVTNRTVRTDDFERDRAAAEAARDTITRALLVNLTSVPLGTSSGGFLYRLNPELGTVERASDSFGGFFVERALTAGAGRATFGLSAQTSAFNQLNGANLRDGSFVTVANQFRDESTPFDTDALTLRIRSNVLTVFGSVGVTDRLEVGAAVPFVRLELDGERRNVYFASPFLQASGEASASGVGDVALRAKYMLASGNRGAFSAGFEVRLPTGDEEDLLGTGHTAYRFLAIGSIESGAVTLNGNGGFVFNGISDELNFAGAASVAVRPKVTIVGEAMIRRVNELRSIELVSAPHPTLQDVDTWRLVPGDFGMVLANAIAGVKWNAAGRVVVGAHLSFPLVKRGLTAPLTPSVAVEYNF